VFLPQLPHRHLHKNQKDKYAGLKSCRVRDVRFGTANAKVGLFMASFKGCPTGITRRLDKDVGKSSQHRLWLFVKALEGQGESEATKAALELSIAE